jgi:DNA-binding LacI/PurR family transcriptional regulator
LRRSRPQITADTVVDNDRGGGYAATAHLIEHGHRRIGFIGGFNCHDGRAARGCLFQRLTNMRLSVFSLIHADDREHAVL